ncbi:GDP-mannose 4,6-dehydratase [Selenihalanaerobacter shriftii]|uniref:CDP-paratose 2-epimerase n=1 Tax=Selenihalanaerobacter shriftii TaxID=142842 RepID=A0A1T4QYS8_9FIRM|nr:GDP-mannose 4,6-dehydratase [Selenihalanaerobacter shriftii]SKA08795.1 CDP-paratose 2-epimerase [Selenihalanaerobacter shriftii]
MKTLITGGCGFLGSNLASYALDNKYDLYILDNFYREGSAKNLEWLNEQGEFRFIHGDIRNKNDIERIIKQIKPDVIFHLAGQVAMTTSLDNPQMDFEVNVQGSINVLEAVRKHSPESIVIYSSTNKVYGDLEYIDFKENDKRYEAVNFPDGFDEKTNLDFHSPYGCSKGAADQYMLDYARMFDLNTVVFRHSSIFGGRQFSTKDQGWVGWFCQKALEIKSGELDEPFTISGNGKQVRDILYADDLINCYFAAVENINQARGELFNIGGGANNSFSLLELFDYLEDLLGIKMIYQEIDWRESDQKVFIANINKAKELLNWQPKVDKFTGVKNMVNWIKELK